MIRFRPAAARELAADVRWYDKQYAGRGQRFAAAVERVLLPGRGAREEAAVVLASENPLGQRDLGDLPSFGA